MSYTYHGQCRKLSGNCQGISHCLESGHPEYIQVFYLLQSIYTLLRNKETQYLCLSLFCNGGIMFLRCPSRLLSVLSSTLSSVHRMVNTFILLCKKIPNGFRCNSQEVIITTNRLNDYILGEIGTGTGEQDTTENQIDTKPVLPCRGGGII